MVGHVENELADGFVFTTDDEHEFFRGGGAHGSVIQGGELRVGDTATIEVAVPVG